MSEALNRYVRFLRSNDATFEIADDLVRDPDHQGSLMSQHAQPRVHSGLIDHDLLEWDLPARSLGSDHATVSTARALVRMRTGLKGKRFLDLGCGTGILGILAASMGAHVVATDIDTEAIRLSRKNARLNNVMLDVRLGNLCDPLDQRDAFDIVVMNLPQKPTPSPEYGLPLGQMGGPDGDDLLSAAIPHVAAHQEPGGRLLCFLHSLAHPRIFKRLNEYYDLKLIQWKIRWFEPDEFEALRPYFRERAESGTSFIWQSVGREGLVAGIWFGTRKARD
jgi:SAM-dependent methyltransferase